MAWCGLAFARNQALLRVSGLRGLDPYRAPGPGLRPVDLSACLCFGLDLEEPERSGFGYAYSVYQAGYSCNLLYRSGAQTESLLDRIFGRIRSRLDVPAIRPTQEIAIDKHGTGSAGSGSPRATGWPYPKATATRLSRAGRNRQP